MTIWYFVLCKGKMLVSNNVLTEICFVACGARVAQKVAGKSNR